MIEAQSLRRSVVFKKRCLLYDYVWEENITIMTVKYVISLGSCQLQIRLCQLHRTLVGFFYDCIIFMYETSIFMFYNIFFRARGKTLTLTFACMYNMSFCKMIEKNQYCCRKAEKSTRNRDESLSNCQISRPELGSQQLKQMLIMKIFPYPRRVNVIMNEKNYV